MDSSFWIEIALLIGIVQGLFLAFLLPRISSANKKANRILSWLLIAASVWVVLYLSTIRTSLLPTQAHVFLDTFPFLFGPLLYLYVKKFLFHDEKPAWIGVHFLPAAGDFLYGIFTFRFTDQEFSFLVRSGALKNEWLIIFTVLMLTILGYWYACVSLMIRFKKEENRVILFRQNMAFLKTFLSAVMVGYVICILFSLDFFFQVKIVGFTGANIGWIIIPLLTYFVSYFAIRQPEVLRVSFREGKKPVSRIINHELEIYKAKLEEVMQKEKLYREPLLKLNDLALRVNLDATKLSWLINEGYGSNFYDFINKYRVEEFMQRLKNNEHKNQTLEALAYHVGFNSKTTFNKSFKKLIQDTPSDYARKLNLSR